jgi:hypothetical protein
MNRNCFRRKTLRITILLLLFALSRETSLWGGESGVFGPDIVPGNVSNDRITLSIRIAEAKGKHAKRIYFRSLLRHRKRNPARRNPPVQSGLPFLSDDPQESAPDRPILSPHFSPGFVARRWRWAWIQGARPRDLGDVVDTMSRNPTERNAVGMPVSATAAEAW